METVRYGAFTVEAGEGALPYTVKNALSNEELIKTDSCYYAHLYALERYCDARMAKIAILYGIDKPGEIQCQYAGGSKC